MLHRLSLPRPLRAAAGFGVLAFFSGLAGLLVSPALRGGGVVGAFEGPDLAGTGWTWWWTSFALSQGQSPFDGTWNFLPTGYRPVALYNLVDAAVVAPLYGLAEPVLAYNLGVLVLLALTGASGYLLCRWMGAGVGAALFGGVVLQTSSFTLGEVWAGRPGQAFLAFLALALGAWIRLLKGEGRWGLAVAAGLLSVLTFLEYWYYGLFLALSVALAAAVHLRSRRVIRPLALAGALTLLGTVPFVVALLDPASLLPGMDRSAGYIEQGPLGRGEAGLNWALDSSLWVGWVLARAQGATGERRILYTLWLTALAPLVGYQRGQGAWIWVALLAWSLTLGPYPKGRDGSVLAEVPLPYLWLYDHLPWFHRFWWPARLQGLLTVALAVLAAVNLTSLARDLGPRGRWLPMGALLAWGVETWATGEHVPIQASEPIRPTESYRAVEGPALTLPVFGPDGGGRFTLWLQAWHRQPILYGLGGHVEGHRPRDMDAYVATNALLRVLHEAEFGVPGPVVIPRAHVDDLARAGFRSVILDRGCYQPARVGTVAPRVEGILRAVFGAPVADDPRTTVWRFTVPTGDLEVAP